MNFFEELERLRVKQPRIALVNLDAENSSYCSYCYKTKNGYLLYASDYNEDCINSYFIYNCRDCVECSYCQKCELLFDCVDCYSSYNLMHCQDCRDCSDLEYCYDCIGCKNCFGCVGLRQKEYHIFNEPYAKEEYKKKILELRKDPVAVRQRLQELRERTPTLFMHMLQNENCIGDYVYQSRNCFACFDLRGSEDCIYCNNVIETKDTLDCSNIYFGNELDYECVAATYLYNSNFCYSCFESRDLEYCEQCFNSHDLFGCIFQKRAEYKILNVQYKKEEYFKKVADIKDQMRSDGVYGKCLSSTYPYEDSLASTFWPKSF